MTKITDTKPAQTAMSRRRTKPASTTPANTPKRRPRRAKVHAKVEALAVAVPRDKTSKRDQLVALLVRDEGATLDQMIALTGWLPHTTRAALTGLRKSGYAIDSDKVDGVRTYRAVAPR